MEGKETGAARKPEGLDAGFRMTGAKRSDADHAPAMRTPSVAFRLVAYENARTFLFIFRLIRLRLVRS